MRNTTGNSSPLAVCRVISVTTPWWSGRRSGIWSASATSDDLLQEPVERGDRRGRGRSGVGVVLGRRGVGLGALGVLPGDAHQLLQVLHPAGVLRVEALLQLGEVAAALRAPPPAPPPAVPVAASSRAASSIATNSAIALAARVEMPVASSARRSAAPNEMRSRAGQRLDARLGALADAAPGGVEHPPDAHRVVFVGDRAQVGQRVADLLALVEAHPADHLVRQAEPDEHLLEHPGLRVGAVEHRDVGRAGTPWLSQSRSISRATQSASACSVSATYPTTCSPAPWSLHSRFGLRSVLRSITALATDRIVWVER